jgi:hypothetical protein
MKGKKKRNKYIGGEKTHLFIDSPCRCIIAFAPLESMKSEAVAAIQLVVVVFAVAAETTRKNPTGSTKNGVRMQKNER